MNEFIILFFSIFLSEFGDKTQLIVLSVSSKTKYKLDVFWGAFFGFVLIDGLSILLGAMLSNIIPKTFILVISGMLFLIYGSLIFVSSHNEIVDITEDKKLKVGFGVFLMIILAEIGDKSQIAAIFFGSQYPFYIVFLSVIFVLSIMTLITIYLSHILFDSLSSKTVHLISGTLFIIMGVFTLLNLLV